MFKYANDALSNLMCANLHTFPEQKYLHSINPGSKFLFHLVYILKDFTQGIFNISFNHILNTITKVI